MVPRGKIPGCDRKCSRAVRPGQYGPVFAARAIRPAPFGLCRGPAGAKTAADAASRKGGPRSRAAARILAENNNSYCRNNSQKDDLQVLKLFCSGTRI